MNTTVIGSGVAAWTLVRELRKADPAHEIRVITSDCGDFYSKPMLSNAFAQGKNPMSMVMTAAVKLVEQHKVELVANAKVEQIDRENKKIVTSQGEFTYEKLVLALGANAIKLPIQGDGAADVLSVNDLWDYHTFRQALEGKKSVAVLGAGLIGCEFANDLIKADITPTVFDLAERPLARLLPEEASHFIQKKLEEKGVVWKLGKSITHIAKNTEGYLLTDSKAESTQADLVLSAVGLTPRMALAKQAGLTTERGILVDQFGRTNDANIFALGDCAQYMGKFVLPYILPVMQAARAIAQTLSGNETEIKFPAMPVMIKTPDCPTVVNPPLPHHVGAWEVEVSEQGIKALFKNAEGALLGMALVGDATKEKQALAGLLPAVE
jgi:rubredoxin-NAD+ reductase